MTDKAQPQAQKAIKPAALVDAMLQSVDALQGVYERETEALEAHDAKGFMALQDSKLEAARDYQEKAKDILIHRNVMREADPALKAKLEDAQANFSALMEKNRKALKRMNASSERLGQKIRNAAKDAVKRERSVSYGESGAMDTDRSKIISTGVIETA